MDQPDPPPAPFAEPIIRAAAPEDAPGIAAMQALPGFRFGTLRLPYPRTEDIRRWLAGLGEPDHVLVAEIGATLVGTAGLRRLSGRRSHVGEIGMGVHDDWTGQRIGTRLLAALVEIADNWLGLHRLQLTVYTDNAPAIALYRRAGFAHEGTFRQDSLRQGRLVDVHAMARLAPAPSGAE
jgi:putative acetyltransferase